jgi:hypothetical protein
MERPGLRAATPTPAAAYAEAGDFEDAVKYQIEANDRFTGEEPRKRGEARLILYRQRRPHREPPGGP